MVTSDATTPDEYIAALEPDRRSAIAAVRDVIRRNLPEGFEEGMQFGMIAYYVPLERFPNTYNGHPLGLASIASQKNHMAIYLNNAYGDADTERRFRERYAASGQKLDMGKSCVRFRRLDALPLDVIGKTIAETDLTTFVERYEELAGSSRAARAAASRG
jgi:uncharacterized protein YdhG (YjbR/CyaY superfamily)